MTAFAIDSYFPIRDSRGRVIAFGGRIIDQGEPKYLNSPETPLFHKGRELYGLYEARQARSDFKRLMIVEGYMDVVRLHQAGITYAVATLGTATTQEHLNKSISHDERVGVLLRWRSRRKAGSLARVSKTPCLSRTMAASSSSCFCPTGTIRTRWWQPKVNGGLRGAIESPHCHSQSFCCSA